MSLPLPLVVTISFEPSGVNATWPGVLVNSGVCAGLRPRSRCQAGTLTRESPIRRKPWTEPAVAGVQHVEQVAADGDADWEGAA
ncbi:hypothetical protein, partial [Trebonia sp.]|uniref:hypothetical protein n=1 Tax=Trebonia sp. TaxID=2767075 RepID=UPI003CC5A8BD